MTWMDFTLKIFELILIKFPEVASWPLATVAIAYFFKTEVRDFLSRTIEIGPKGAKAVPPRQNIPHTLEELAEGQITSTSTLPPPDEIVAQIEKNIRESLAREGVESKPISEQKAIFVREYAVLALQSHYQAINNSIFGSQFAALLHMRDRKPKSRKSLAPFFKNHEARAEVKELDPKTFDDWIGFLLRAQLVELQTDGNYVATAMGQQYIDNIAPRAGLSEKILIL